MFKELRTRRARWAGAGVAGLLTGGLAAGLLAVTAAAAPGDCTSVVRFASTSNTVYVTGEGTCTLTDLAAKGIKPAQLSKVDAAAKVWLLTANLRLEGGARVDLHGGTDGDVNQLRLRSDPDSGPVAGQPRKFVFIRAEYGTLDLKSTKVTSWSGTGPDTNYADGRAFIHVRSLKDSTGEARESRMDIDASEIAYLGYNAAESYGLVWKVSGTPTAELFAGVNVLGDVTGSNIHHNYFGAYTYGAYDMEWVGNQFHHNVSYGLDPHDDSDNLLIKGNRSYDNGNHGIICSQRCDHLVIEDNVVERNTGHGIMIHRSVTDTVVRGNTSNNNTDTGIVVFDSDGNTIEGNTVRGNLRGVRLSVGSSSNTFTGNTIDASKSYGIYFYKGSDAPVGDDGRPRNNTFTGNRITGTTGYALRLGEADGNTFTGNTWTGNTSGLYFNGSTGNRVDGIPDGMTVETYGASGVPARTTLSGFGRAVVKLNPYGTTTLEDTEGRVFDLDGKALATTVGTGTSSLALTSANAGTSATVYRRALVVRTGGGSAGVDPTAWTTGTSPTLSWSAKLTVASQTLSAKVGGLTSGKSYKVTRTGMTTRTLTASSSGEVSFTDAPGTTNAVTYTLKAG